MNTETYRSQEEKAEEHVTLMQKETAIETIEKMRKLLSLGNWSDAMHKGSYILAMREGLGEVLRFINEDVRICLPNDSVSTVMQFLGERYERINKINSILEWPGTVQEEKLKFKLGDLLYQLQKEIETM